MGYAKDKYTPPEKIRNVRERVYPEENMGIVSFPRDTRNYLLHTYDMKPLKWDSDI